MRMNFDVFNELNEGEQSLVRWQYDMNSGFFTAFWNAAKIADDYHLKCLKRAFPKHVEALENYRYKKDWWPDLQRKLEILHD